MKSIKFLGWGVKTTVGRVSGEKNKGLTVEMFVLSEFILLMYPWCDATFTVLLNWTASYQRHWSQTNATAACFISSLRRANF